jgi:GTP-binding protein
MRAIDRCDVALLVLDATEMFSAQDTHIAGYIQQAVKGIVIIVNKWDLVKGEDQVLWAENTRKQFKFMAYAPVMFLSAKFGRGVNEVMPQAYKVYQERTKQIPAAELKGVIRDAIASHNMPRKGKMMLSVSGVTQTDINPPTFTFKVNNTKLVHFSFKRFLENRLRDSFGFTGTPLKIEFKAGNEK